MDIIAISIGTYLALVVAFELLVITLGARQAASGEPPTGDFVAIETSDDRGKHTSVVAAVEVDGHLYVSANHWPRRWHRRALANPEVDVTRDGVRAKYLAREVKGAERERAVRGYPLPLAIRALTGFPPRAFLRLDPR